MNTLIKLIWIQRKSNAEINNLLRVRHVRLDARQYMMPHPFDFPGKSGQLRLLAITAGLSLIF